MIEENKNQKKKLKKAFFPAGGEHPLYIPLTSVL